MGTQNFKENSFRRKNCRLCKSDKLQLTLHLEPTPVGDAYFKSIALAKAEEAFPLDLFLCLSCGHAQLLDVISPELLYKNFIYETAISFGLKEHFQNYAKEVLSRTNLPENSLVIDIGSNDGTLLSFFKQSKMRVLGIDPAEEIAKKATNAGVKTLPTYFTNDLAKNIKKDYGNANLISFNNAFANIDDLDNVIQGIKTLLDEKGVLVIETGYLVDLVQKGLFDNIYHEHLGYFSIKPLDAYLRQFEMEIFDVQRIPTKGGSIRVFIQHKNGPRKVLASFQELMKLERALEMDTPGPLENLAQKLQDVKTKLHELFKELKSKNKTIAGYGASVGTTTLVYHFKIDSFLDFIVDDNPAKHDTYSPGHHIPVYPPQALLEKNPDYVAILSWRYANFIIQKNYTFKEQGGLFINPYPQINIVKK